ncbi:hypothetical protein FJZ19_00380 [Candidatus Pacearchaeota archaeon]|nr:hypothetical protein [Candidatus Pacearchaeota archaeon]
MKRVLLIFLLLLPIASAVNLDIKENYKPGETMIFSMEANFLSPVTQENIYFYSNNVQIPLVSDITQINDKYYIYALLPALERNYTFTAKNLHYFENGFEKTGSIEKNFSVSGNITDFSVKPGFIVAKNNFSMSVESKSQSLVVVAKFLNSTQSINVPAGQERTIYFTKTANNLMFTEISLSALNTQYKIPAAILSSFNDSAPVNISLQESFEFSKYEYNFSVNKNKEDIFSIYLKNTGKNTSITINFSDELEDVMKISPVEFDVKSGERKRIEITIKSSQEGRLRGIINAYSEDYSALSYIIINSLEENAALPARENETFEETCAFKGGEKCGSGEKCSEKTVNASDGDCCLATCKEKQNYTSIIIGIILILAVGAGIFFMYKRAKAKQNPADILKKQEEKFEERMSGEVRDSLSKS